MKTKNLVIGGILLALGTLLHSIVPPVFGNVKPDFLLSMMFIAIIINPTIQGTVGIGLAAGILAALTTGFPGGQLPSVIDKLVAAIFVYFLIKIFFGKKLLSNEFTIFHMGTLTFLGTLLSGVVFLTSALFLVGLPMPMKSLILVVVLPTSCVNTIFNIFALKTLKVGNIDITKYYKTI